MCCLRATTRQSVLKSVTKWPVMGLSWLEHRDELKRSSADIASDGAPAVMDPSISWFPFFVEVTRCVIDQRYAVWLFSPSCFFRGLPRRSERSPAAPTTTGHDRAALRPYPLPPLGRHCEEASYVDIGRRVPRARCDRRLGATPPERSRHLDDRGSARQRRRHDPGNTPDGDHRRGRTFRFSGCW